MVQGREANTAIPGAVPVVFFPRGFHTMRMFCFASVFCQHVLSMVFVVVSVHKCSCLWTCAK